MDSTQYAFTVLTPTFNRAELLSRAYHSLAAQTFKNFEWLVVDDGSTDGTREQVQAWAARAVFPVRYLWQDNAHKKAAFNHGVREARGELLIVLDDDDEIPPDALQTLKSAWDGIGPAREHYVGVTGLCAYADGTVVGDLFPEDVFDSSASDMFFRHEVGGEKFGCQRVDVLRRYPFPEDIAGFVPESLVWWEIARGGYRSRFINQVVRTYHATPGSLSAHTTSPQVHARGLYLLNWMMLQHFMGQFWHRPKLFLLAAARLTRFGLHVRRSGPPPLPARYRLTRVSAWLLVILMAPAGWALYMRDRRRR